MAQKDYEEFFELLNSNNVKYLIVGAHAVAFHARPRATKDIDILHDTSPQSATALLKTIREFFGGYDMDLTVDDLCNPESIVQLGVAPVRIDLLGGIAGIHNFEDAWAGRVKGKYGTVDVWYIALDDLMRAKETTGRNQDKADLTYLKRACTGKKSNNIKFRSKGQ